MLPAPNFFTQLFVSQTCHNATKKVSFSFSRPQACSNNIGQIPVERRQCCLLFSLHSRRLQNIIANSYFIWMLYKDTHLTISTSRMKFSMQPREGLVLCTDFLGMSHVALSSASVALFLFRMFGRTSVGWLSNFKKERYIPITQS